MRTCNFPTEQDIQNLLEHHNLPKTWSFTESIEEVIDNADVMYTDVGKHGCENESQNRLEVMKPIR